MRMVHNINVVVDTADDTRQADYSYLIYLLETGKYTVESVNGTPTTLIIRESRDEQPTK